MSNKDIETNINENTRKSETTKEKRISCMYSVRRIHRTAVIKEEDPAETVRIPDRENRCRQITAVRQSALRHRTQQQESTGSKENREAGSRKSTGQTSGKKRKTGQK